MNKNESKYFNTAIKMNKALVSLLEKKDFEYITVKEVCETAGVNRSTFYLHYENMTDLLGETARFITEEFRTYFPDETDRLTDGFEKEGLSDLVFIKPVYLLPYLTYVKENKRVFKTSVKHIGTLDFEGVYERLFRYVFDPILARFHFEKGEREYVMKYYLTGITAVVMQWLKGDCKEPCEYMADVIMHCVFGKDGQIKTDYC